MAGSELEGRADWAAARFVCDGDAAAYWRRRDLGCCRFVVVKR
jgi:hypothetical protein